MSLKMVIEHSVNDYQGTEIAVFTMDPCVRTIFTTSGLMSLPFPYVNFVFRYRKVPKGYLWPGLYGNGLGVYFSNEPLKENVKFRFCPTDNYNGMVCTNHDWDSKVYKNKGKMYKTMINFWLGAMHPIHPPDIFIISGYRSAYKAFTGADKLGTPPVVTLDQWRKMSLEECLVFDWPKSLHEPLGFKPSYIDKPIKL